MPGKYILCFPGIGNSYSCFKCGSLSIYSSLWNENNTHVPLTLGPNHVKNIAFLMDKSGNWTLSPAFDMTYSYNPQGDWTGRHQMSLNGKRDDFTIDDFKACAKNAFMKRGRAEEIVRQVREAVFRWKYFADESGVSPEVADGIAKAHRTDILK